MQSDFVALCKAARERIPVPDPPLAAIRKAAQSGPTPRFKNQWAGPIALVWASASIVAAAAGAAVWSSTHVSLGPSGGIELSAQHLAYTRNPTDDSLRSAAAQADFPVVLPAGLPEGTTLLSLARAGSSAILLQYNLPGAWRRDNHVLALVLANPKSFAATATREHGDYLLDLSGGTAHRGVHWTIGHEDVIMAGSTLTAAELAHIKSAMLAQARQH